MNIPFKNYICDSFFFNEIKKKKLTSEIESNHTYISSNKKVINKSHCNAIIVYFKLNYTP